MQGVEIDRFNMSGRDMCAMGKESFLSRTPQWMGDILWEHLETLQRGESEPGGKGLHIAMSVSLHCTGLTVQCSTVLIVQVPASAAGDRACC